jgi:hypothetical protein
MDEDEWKKENQVQRFLHFLCFAQFVAIQSPIDMNILKAYALLSANRTITYIQRSHQLGSNFIIASLTISGLTVRTSTQPSSPCAAPNGDNTGILTICRIEPLKLVLSSRFINLLCATEGLSLVMT